LRVKEKRRRKILDKKSFLYYLKRLEEDFTAEILQQSVIHQTLPSIGKINFTILVGGG
jgi:hypothetical protein